MITTRVRLDDAVRVRERLNAPNAIRERLERIERVRLNERVHLYDGRERVRDLIPKRLTILDVESGKCRWPVGRTRDVLETHLFCGASCRKDKVYCEMHERRAFDRRPRRERAING